MLSAYQNVYAMKIGLHFLFGLRLCSSFIEIFNERNMNIHNKKVERRGKKTQQQLQCELTMNTNFILIFYYLVDEQRKYESLPRYMSKKHFISILLLEFAVV